MLSTFKHWVIQYCGNLLTRVDCHKLTRQPTIKVILGNLLFSIIKNIERLINRLGSMFAVFWGPTENVRKHFMFYVTFAPLTLNRSLPRGIGRMRKDRELRLVAFDSLDNDRQQHKFTTVLWRTYQNCTCTPYPQRITRKLKLLTSPSKLGIRAKEAQISLAFFQPVVIMNEELFTTSWWFLPTTKYVA